MKNNMLLGLKRKSVKPCSSPTRPSCPLLYILALSMHIFPSLLENQYILESPFVM